MSLAVPSSSSGGSACSERHRFRQADRLWLKRDEWLLPPHEEQEKDEWTEKTGNVRLELQGSSASVNSVKSTSENRCRICREGDSAELGPLCWPCKCMGSVRFVHEECLKAWQRSSGRSSSFKCELCKQEFRFQKVYSADAPSDRSVSVVSLTFFIGIAKRCVRASKQIFVASARLVLVLGLWAFMLPVLTTWMFRFAAYSSAARTVLAPRANFSGLSSVSLPAPMPVPVAEIDANLSTLEASSVADHSANFSNWSLSVSEAVGVASAQPGADAAADAWFPDLSPLPLLFDAVVGVVLCLAVVAIAMALGSVFDWLCDYFETRGIRVPGMFELFRGAPALDEAAGDAAPAPAPVRRRMAGVAAVREVDNDVVAAAVVNPIHAGVHPANEEGQAAGVAVDHRAVEAAVGPERALPADAAPRAAELAPVRIADPAPVAVALAREGLAPREERGPIIPADAVAENIDDVLRVDELIGLTGPITAIFERFFTILFVLGVMFLFCVFLPRMVGTAVLFTIRGLRAWYFGPDVASIVRPPLSRLMLLGYTSLVAFTVLALTAVKICTKRRMRVLAAEAHRHVSFLAFLLVYMKVLVLIACEAVVFPLVIGTVIQAIAFAADFGRTSDDTQRPLMVVLPPNSNLRNGSIMPLGLNEPAALMLARAANSTIGHSVVGSEAAATFIYFISQHLDLFVAVARWVLGFATLYQLSHAVSYIRKKTRPGLLWFFRNPDDPDFDPINEMIEYSAERHAVRICMSAALYTTVLLFWLYIPVQIWTGNPLFVKYLPSLLVDILRVAPFDVRLRDVHDVPLDLLVLHILLPFCVQHIKPIKRALSLAYHLTFHSAAKMLGLHAYIHGRPGDVIEPRETTEQAQVRADRLKPARWFRVRITVFIGVIFLSAFMTILLGFSVPVWSGRRVLARISTLAFGRVHHSTHPLAQPLNDLYAVVVGTFVLHTLANLGTLAFDNMAKLTNMLKSFRRDTVVFTDNQVEDLPAANADEHDIQLDEIERTAATRSLHALLAFGKWTILISTWLGAVPYLLGTFLELALAVPLRVGLYECPALHPWQAWLMGLLLQQLWVRTVFFAGHFHIGHHVEVERDAAAAAAAVADQRLPYLWQCFSDFSNLGDMPMWLPRLERIYADGFMRVQLLRSLKEVVAPPLVVFGSMLALPHACGVSISYGLLALLGDISDHDALHILSVVQRMSWLVALCFLAVVFLVRLIISSVRAMQREIADDLWLVGTRLGNLDER